MNIKNAAKLLYGLTGTLLFFVGTVVLLFRTGVLPANMQSLVLSFAKGDLNTLHLIQEFSSLMIFAALMNFWAIMHYEQSGPFHWSMTLFWGLLALIHWFDVRGEHESIKGPIINTIPFVLFQIVGLLRKRS